MLLHTTYVRAHIANTDVDATVQWQWGRRENSAMPMMPREPYVWAQWHVCIPPCSDLRVDSLRFSVRTNDESQGRGLCFSTFSF